MTAETAKTAGRKYRLIACEEAFATAEQVEAYRKAKNTLWNDPDLNMWRFFLDSLGTVLRRLLDVDEERIRIMDEAGVDVHLLSLTAPGVQLFDADTATALAEDANDQLAEAVERHPTRFAGLATFAPQDPARAAREIERAIKKLKLNGLVINSHTNGEYLNDRKFWPIFEAATECDVPIYIHPRMPPAGAAEMLKVGVLAGLWGFQMETGTHAMRLIMGGVFDQFPTLKIVLGHMGEGLPYWLYRIDYLFNQATMGGTRFLGHRLQHKPSEYVLRNFTITTSGMNTHPVLQYCHNVLGPERIMFAIDYPYQETMEAAQFINTAPLPEADVEKIAHANAEKLFRIAPAAKAAGI
jgi:5-carboxyvanillate decarboxylase